MNTLFPLEEHLPPGFTYSPGFITEKEEMELLYAIKQLELKHLNFQGYEAKRKTASFGYDWSFEKRELTKGKTIPSEFSSLLSRVAGYIKIPFEAIAELLVTEYPPGSVINWHRDAPPFDIITGISLLSDCTFKFRPYDKTKQSRKNIFSLPVHRRSIYIMKEESRSDWEHSIAPVKQQRYSITLRTFR